MVSLYDFTVWVYGLSILQMILLSLVFSIFMCLIKKHLSGFWRIFSLIGFIACVFLILKSTVVDRSIKGNNEIILIPFYSYYNSWGKDFFELIKVNFMNIILFIPIGLFGYDLFPKKCSSKVRIITLVVLAAILSISIETVQYFYCLGLTEIDDVIHNSSGAFLGSIIISSKICNDKSNKCNH